MAKARGARYDVHPGVEMVRKWREELPAKTGRSSAQWKALLGRSGAKTVREGRDWLRKEHGLPSMVAWTLANDVLGEDADGIAWDGGPEAYLAAAPGLVDALYGGSRAAARPIHDAVEAACRALGDDVRVCPCKTMVPFYRRHVFAEVRPGAGGSLDLFLALGESAKAAGRLVKPTGAMGNERKWRLVRLDSPAAVDAEVRGWLRAAYDRDAEGAPREKVKVGALPAAFSAALAKEPRVKAFFDGLAPGQKRDFASWIGSAAKEETRAKRLDRVMEALRDGKKRVY